MAAFARERAACSGAAIDLVLDQAGWHLSGKLVVPEDVKLVERPAYSPELQPAEHLWPVIDEVVAHRAAEPLEELASWESARCVALSDDKE